ncbi:MAG TPA: superoxide dismutase [Acidobacteriota bacterium]|nr:superoxide dismutase [Acidobacteriota bacterium]
MPHSLVPLPYPHDALEPFIDARTMEIHHGKHHQAYVNNLNAALEKTPRLFEVPLDRLLAELDSLVPEESRLAVRNHGGGVLNHNLFWKSMKPNGGGAPTGMAADAINGAFGSFEKFKELFDEAGMKRFGSGWVWLVADAGNTLKVTSTANQDSPLTVGQRPLLGNDVWEHAYYLKYQNRRNEYLAAWWNVVNWDEVNRRLRG